MKLARAERLGPVMLALACVFWVSQVAAAETELERRLVAVHAVGRLYRTDLEQALHAWFPPERFELKLEYEPRLSAAALARSSSAQTLHVWLSIEGQFVDVRVIRSDVPSDRYLLRRLPWSGKLDLLVVEQIAQVAHSSSEALLSRAASTPPAEFFPDLESAPASVRPAAPKPAAPKRLRRRTAPLPRLSLELSGRERGSEPLALGVGLSAAALYRTRALRIGPALGFAYRAATAGQYGPLRLSSQGLEGVLGVLATSADETGWNASLSLIFERNQLAVASSAPDVEALPVPARLGASAEAGVGAHVAAWQLRIGFRLLLRMQFAPPSYRIEQTGLDEVVLRGRRWQPGVLFEFGPSFGG